MKKLVITLIGIVIGLVLLDAVFGAVLKRPAGRDKVRAFNRDVLNPWMLQRAGKGNFYAAVIETIGRKTGDIRRTPVVADPVEGGFVIPLPYGEGVDWLRNAIAAGSATLYRHDQAFPVTSFEILDGAATEPLLPRERRLSYGLTGIEKFLRASTAG
jgi:hypothetical protein